jgi:hypothetical protein
LEGILNNNNGCSYIQELNWISNSDLQLFTDTAVEKLWAVLHIWGMGRFKLAKTLVI